MLGKFFLNSRKDRRKDAKTEFFVRCRRTYVLNKYMSAGRRFIILDVVLMLLIYFLGHWISLKYFLFIHYPSILNPLLFEQIFLEYYKFINLIIRYLVLCGLNMGY